MTKKTGFLKWDANSMHAIGNVVNSMDAKSRKSRKKPITWKKVDWNV